METLGARADFSKLPYCEQQQAVQICPFTSDLALEETKKQPTPGVHLHWTLPEALRTLRKQPEEEGRSLACDPHDPWAKGLPIPILDH
jgi:hypothetical protein